MWGNLPNLLPQELSSSSRFNRLNQSEHIRKKTMISQPQELSVSACRQLETGTDSEYFAMNAISFPPQRYEYSCL